MLLSRTNAVVGANPSAVSIEQSVGGRQRVCLPGRSAEPVVSAAQLVKVLEQTGAEPFRPLLPVGYQAGVEAYRRAVGELSAEDLTQHYTTGLRYFHDTFIPCLKDRLTDLSGGVWSFRDHHAYAAGSDVDLITHLIEGLTAHETVCLYPGDWFGFYVGATHPQNLRWTEDSQHHAACLCIPSVRNGHLTEEMLGFLADSQACLLNLNLYPTLSASERQEIAHDLLPILPKAALSISFSRGFGLTASQLGVLLIPKDHPWQLRFASQWSWFTYFYNAIAARAFLALDLAHRETVDEARRNWVHSWLYEHDLPIVATGSYYVKSFRIVETLPEIVKPLLRYGLVRLCFKPPQT
jgi:hypothetical protein